MVCLIAIAMARPEAQGCIYVYQANYKYICYNRNHLAIGHKPMYVTNNS